jgi:putative transposase
MIKLIDRYGIEIYDQPSEVFTKEFKEEAITQALSATKAIEELSLDLGLRSNGILTIGFANTRKTGIMSLSRRKDDALLMNKKNSHNPSRRDLEKRIQQLEEENLKLRIVNAYVKKLNALDQKHQKK